jgi:hypothetical protein
MEKKSVGNLDFLAGGAMCFAGAGGGGVNVVTVAGTGIETSPVVDVMPSAVDEACAIMVASVFDD